MTSAFVPTKAVDKRCWHSDSARPPSCSSSLSSSSYKQQARLTRRRRCGSRFVWFCCPCGIAVTHVDPYVVLCRAPVSRGDRAYCDCTACGVLCVCGLVGAVCGIRAQLSMCRGAGRARVGWPRAETRVAARRAARGGALQRALRPPTRHSAKAQAPRRGRAPGTAARAAAAAYLRNKGRPSGWPERPY